MYHIRVIKALDIFIQILILTGMVLYGWSGDDAGGAFFGGLFIMGGWQVISCVVHVFTVPKASRGNSRRIYEWALVFTFTVGWVLAVFYLYIGPAMAIWYFATCAVETHQYASLPKPTYN